MDLDGNPLGYAPHSPLPLPSPSDTPFATLSSAMLLAPSQVPVQPPVSLPVISAAPVLTATDHPGDVFVSTVFVGNISERASDGLVRQLLMVSGSDVGGTTPEHEIAGLAC